MLGIKREKEVREQHREKQLQPKREEEAITGGQTQYLKTGRYLREKKKQTQSNIMKDGSRTKEKARRTTTTRAITKRREEKVHGQDRQIINLTEETISAHKKNMSLPKKSKQNKKIKYQHASRQMPRFQIFPLFH